MNYLDYLKKLSCYLPYEVKGLITDVNNTKFKEIGVLDCISLMNEYSDYRSPHDFYNDMNYSIKVILRPLKDVGRIINVNDTTFTPKEKLSDSLRIQLNVLGTFNVNDLIVSDYNYLLSLHFDLFGLIEEGFAVDINTL